MHFVNKLGCETVYVVESEIDCLYLWSHGKPAIALGGSNMSQVQRQLILRSPIKTLVLSTDNDVGWEKD
jgi:DNA primase